MKTFFPLIVAAITAVANASLSSESSKLKGRQVGIASQYATLTFYGYPDNCDEGGCYCPDGHCKVAERCTNPDGSSRGDKPGGDGTWIYPLSMTYTEGGNFEKCKIVWIPYLRKYGIFDDTCAVCEANHIDIWVESSCKDEFEKVCNCENYLTPNVQKTVYYNLESETSMGNVTVYDGPLYESDTGICKGVDVIDPDRKRDVTGQMQSLPRNSARASGGLMRRPSCYTVRECLCDSCN